MLTKQSLLLAAGACVVATSAFSANYECTLSPFTGNLLAIQNGNPIASFTMDTSTQDNASVDAGDSLGAGCVVFRSRPELMACYIADRDTVNSAATADVGSSVLAVMGRVAESQYQLVCLKR